MPTIFELLFFTRKMKCEQLGYFASTPHPVTVANEGFGWDSLLKMVHNPGGDWHPGWGVDLKDTTYPLNLKNFPEVGTRLAPLS